MANVSCLRAVCLVLSIAVAAISAYLTTSFLYELGESFNTPVTLGAVGLVLDITKCVSPAIFLLFVRKNSYIAAFFALCMCLALSAVSFSASVAALEKGVVASKLHGREFDAINEKIQLYKTQIDDLRTLATAQQNAQQVSKSQKTLAEVRPLLNKVDALTSELAKTTSDTSVSKYGMMVVYVVSAALELVSWLFTLALSVMRSELAVSAVERSAEQSGALANKSAVYSQYSSFSSETTRSHQAQTFAVNGNDEHCGSFGVVSNESLSSAVEHCVSQSELIENESAVFSQKASFSSEEIRSHQVQEFSINGIGEKSQTENRCVEQLMMDVRNAIIKHEVRPSQRGIAEKFKLSRKSINDILEQMNNQKLIKPYRNGYTWA